MAAERWLGNLHLPYDGHSEREREVTCISSRGVEGRMILYTPQNLSVVVMLVTLSLSTREAAAVAKLITITKQHKQQQNPM